MLFDVLVTQEANERYTARVLSLPDIVVSGTDERAVLEQVQKALANLHSHSHVVRLDIPDLPGCAADPWLRVAGMWEHDPDWEEFQRAITAYRRMVDAQTDSTPE